MRRKHEHVNYTCNIQIVLKKLLQFLCANNSAVSFFYKFAHYFNTQKRLIYTTRILIKIPPLCVK